jgi:hypothetical protein
MIARTGTTPSARALPEPGIGPNYTNERPVLTFEYPTLKQGKSKEQVIDSIAQLALTNAAAMLADKKIKRTDLVVLFHDPSIYSHSSIKGPFSFGELMDLDKALQKKFGQTDGFKGVNLVNGVALRVCYSMNPPNITLYMARDIKDV